MGFTITGVVTQVIKMGVGRPRPDMLSRCQPYEGAHDHPVFGLSDYTICTQTDKRLLDDGFKSFPSGHSSCELAVLFFVLFAGVWIEDQANADVVFAVSFAGMGFLTFYLAGKMHLADVKGHRVGPFIQLCHPSVGADASRLHRHEHGLHCHRSWHQRWSLFRVPLITDIIGRMLRSVVCWGCLLVRACSSRGTLILAGANILQLIGSLGRLPCLFP
jgi:hypothetical protein